MPNTFYLLNSQTLTTSAASVSFSSIPQSGYTDLKVVASIRTNLSSIIDGVRVRFNGDTTVGNYIARRVYGDGTTPYSDANAVGMLFADGDTASSNVFSNADIYIVNYLGATTKSTYSQNAAETSATTQYQGINATTWSNTSAINTITMSPENGTAFLTNSNFYLYGIKNS